MDFFSTLSGILALGACLLERPGEGEEKKEELKTLVYRVLPEENWNINLQLFDSVLDVSIDLVVAWLNRMIWKKA